MAILSLLSGGGALLKNWKMLFGIGIIAAVSIAFYQQNSEIESLNADIALLERDKMSLELKSQSYLHTIDNISAEVLKLKQLSDEQKQRSRMLEESIKLERASHEKQLSELRKKRAPHNTHDAIDWLVDIAQEDLQW